MDGERGSFLPRHVPVSVPGAQLPEDVSRRRRAALKIVAITIMPYEVKQALGVSATDVISAINSVSQTVTDPYLPEAMCRVKQLYQIQTGKKPDVCAATPMNRTGGIGVKKAIYPLRGAVYAEQHPWVYPAAVAAVVGVPFLLGYLFGKGS